jgi:transposase InsO family protein
VPREIFIDQGRYFTSKLIESITQQYQINHMTSSPYHLQANGKVECTNKVLESILMKSVQIHHKDKEDKFPEAFWAYRTTWRNTTRFTPYELVYIKKSFSQ